MKETLDLAVARAVHAARLIERALHDPGPWEMDYAGQRFPVVKVVHSDHLHLRGVMPPQCWVDEPEPILSLVLRDEIVASRPVDHPGDGAHCWDWMLGVEKVATSA